MGSKINIEAIKASILANAKDNVKGHLHLTLKERVELVQYLNSIEYNYPIDDPPRMEKIFMGARKHTDDQ